MSTSAQLRANRDNAQLSTGPRTEIGKAISSRNALATGLTGRTVLLPTDDKDAYESHLAGYRKLFKPGNVLELNLVQAIADTDWRLTRIPILISGIEARAYAEVEVERTMLASGDGSNPLLSFDAAIEGFLRYERQIRNLYLQESRLHRRRAKDLAELQGLQSQRQKAEAMALRVAATQYRACLALRKPFNPNSFGFEFSMEQIIAEAERTKPHSTPPLVEYSVSSPDLEEDLADDLQD
jgi:hypothetical protein